MNADSRDDLDRTIDEALASATAGEPRRVNGASIRQAIECPSPLLPLWLAVAAVVMVGLALALRSRAPVEPSSGQAAHSTESRVLESPRSASEPSRGLKAPTPGGRSATRASIEATADESWQGLPRIAIAAIDLPEPLLTARLVADPIQILPIEIPTLVVSNSSDEETNPDPRSPSK